jgi:hypothetical protein
MLARSCVERILERVADGRAELMVASHKQGSVQAAARRMHGLGLAPATSGAPHLAFTSAQNFCMLLCYLAAALLCSAGAFCDRVLLYDQFTEMHAELLGQHAIQTSQAANLECS